jgi:hypothetical protein
MKLNLLFMFIIFALTVAMEQTSVDDDYSCTCGHSNECVKNEDCSTCVCGDGPDGCDGCGITHCCFLGLHDTLEKCNPEEPPNYCYCKISDNCCCFK